MFHTLLALMLGILIGWNLHTVSQHTSTPQVIHNTIKFPIDQPQKLISFQTKINAEELCKEKAPEKNNTHLRTRQHLVDASQKKSSSQQESIENDNFYTLLHQNLFSDALALYMDASGRTLEIYKNTLSDYFTEKKDQYPQETILQILEYLDLEPQNNTIQLQLVAIYLKEEQYKEALMHMDEVIDNSDEINTDTLKDKLITISELYIHQLTIAKNFHELVTFLEDRINYDLHPTFYKYTLAKYYTEMKNYDKAQTLINEITFNEIYKDKIALLQKQIDNSRDEDKLYKYKLPLKKNGAHYTITALVDNTPVLLLLDTGATTTTINEAKISTLKVLRTAVTVYTAGGTISSKLKEAEKFSIGEEIEFNNFKIMSNIYPDEHTDGLLGMNFFKHFKFKIDQEEQMLYLSQKKSI